MIQFSYNDLLRPTSYKPGKPIRFIQEKKDGTRVLLRKHGGMHHVDAKTRNGLSDYWPWLYRIDHIRMLVDSLPPFTALDCELWAPKTQATSVISLLHAQDPRLQLTAFAAPWWCDADMRRVSWATVEQLLIASRVSVTETRVITALRTDERLTEEQLAGWKKRAADSKIEGWVAKRFHYGEWYKIKPNKTVDCFVSDFTISTSDSFAGGLKAVKVSVYDGTATRELAQVSSGFEADFRMSCKPAELIGKVCEVSYDSLAGRGRLKFPRFERWRDDKTPEECLVSQIAEQESEDEG